MTRFDSIRTPRGRTISDTEKCAREGRERQEVAAKADGESGPSTGRGLTEVSHRSHIGLTEVSQRSHRGPTEALAEALAEVPAGRGQTGGNRSASAKNLKKRDWFRGGYTRSIPSFFGDRKRQPRAGPRQTKNFKNFQTPGSAQKIPKRKFSHARANFSTRNSDALGSQAAKFQNAKRKRKEVARKRARRAFSR